MIFRTKHLLSMVILLLALLLLSSCSDAPSTVNEPIGISFQQYSAIKEVADDTAAYLLSAVSVAQIGNTGGEWSIIGLARSNYDVPQAYFDDYYSLLESYTKERAGILHSRKYTEYSRVILALTAIGKDPRDVAGYDLLLPLADFETTILQGVNGAMWALIALDSADYEMPTNTAATIQATREMYVDHILSKQRADGSWNLTGDEADPDITAAALLALANYQERRDVKSAISRALDCLSNMQNADASFTSWQQISSETIARIIEALIALDISIIDERFVKNDNTLIDAFLAFYREGEGFAHSKKGSGNNIMPSEQALCALVTIERAYLQQNSTYDMTDIN